uniref:Uncharacterized protein n=1 Tax=Romanomermis culicivorax TaxID=13658 RepID=A0A915JVC6_ROMCU
MVVSQSFSKILISQMSDLLSIKSRDKCLEKTSSNRAIEFLAFSYLYLNIVTPPLLFIAIEEPFFGFSSSLLLVTEEAMDFRFRCDDGISQSLIVRGYKRSS